MKKHYPWLWFDADGTLFDYNKAETIALKQAFVLLNLPFEDSYLDVYREVNANLWRAFERQEITQSALRLRRFESLLEAIQLSAPVDQLSNVYLEQLGSCAELVGGAYDVLQTLHKTSRIAIVTNGLQSVQRGRFARSTIQAFIDEFVISEEIGVAKPNPAFFDVVSTRTGNPPKREVLLIGDSLTSDIQGGVGYGLDTCWYNPNLDPRPEGLAITYEIRRLQELLDLIE